MVAVQRVLTRFKHSLSCCSWHTAQGEIKRIASPTWPTFTRSSAALRIMSAALPS